MPESSASTPTKGTSTNGSESSGGFKSFWRKSERTTQPQNVTFVPQDPSGKKRPNRLKSLLRQRSATSSQEDGENPGSKGAQNRRDQVYQAQKRHRNRKAEYVQTLEGEVARLQHLDALVNSEKNALAHQNNAMRQLLASQSLDYNLDSLDLTSSTQPRHDLSQLGGAMVDIRFDADVGHDRTFLDLLDFTDEDMMWSSDGPSSGGTEKRLPARPIPVDGDSWAALDFILALEWPCQEHIKHPAINPEVNVPEACDVAGLHGHALTATAAVYQSSLPAAGEKEEGASMFIPTQHGLNPNAAGKWQLPHSEIDKLVDLSDLLELDEESMTPAQAYTAIRHNVPNETFLRPTLEALKVPLASLVQCHGFGACMDAPMFWQHLDAALETLKFTRPELE